MKLRRALASLAGLGASILAAGSAHAGCELRKLAEFRVTMSGLRPLIPAKVNGHEAQFLADSGAYVSVLTSKSAAKFGLKTIPAPMDIIVEGARGRADVSIATADDFEFAGFVYHHVEMLVSDQLGGDVAGVLGQDVFHSADVEYDLANGVIRLFSPKGCDGASLAYWAGDGPSSEIVIHPPSPAGPHTRGAVTVNGVTLRAMFDTGAPNSQMTLYAAQKAGVTVGGAGVTDGGLVYGMGSDGPGRSWVAPFASFKIGGEEIKNTRLRFGGLDGDTDMLIGADFFLSHRVYVSNALRRMFFTYNGGPVFNLEAKSPVTPASAAPPPEAAASDYSNVPTDASGFARRAAAFAARRDFVHAIDDLTHAIALSPKNPDYLYRRAIAELAIVRHAEGMADLDLALTLDPSDFDALVERASLRSAWGQAALAHADLVAASKALTDDGDHRYAIGAAFEAAGFHRDAIDQFDRWFAARQKSGEALLAGPLNARCWSRAELGEELDKALADCDQALKLSPRTPAILDSRGLVKLRSGDLDGAIADYGAALRSDPKLSWSLYGRGLAELKTGDKTAADADIQAALAIDALIAEKLKALGAGP